MIDPAEKRYVSSGIGARDALDSASSPAIVARFVGHGKRVLEVGYDGGFSDHLTSAGNRVTGLDMVERAIDFDRQSFGDVVGEETFDAIVFGDVLEGVRDPWRLLGQARSSLSSGGFVVLSIPNVAHGNVRLSLLRGSFEYARPGRLDDAHLRLFTLRSVRELCLRAGYRIEAIERTKVPLFGASDLIPNVDERAFGADVIDEIRRDPDHDTLQFVIRAVPVADGDQLRVALDELSDVESKLVSANGAIDRLERLLDARHRDVERLAEFEAVQAQRESERLREGEITAALRERVAMLETEIGDREKYAAADAEDQRVALAEELSAVRAREEDREETVAALRAEATELRANLIEASRSVGEAYALRAAVDQVHATLASVHAAMQAKVSEAEFELARVNAVASGAELESTALRTALEELRRDYESLGESNRKTDVDREMLAARLAEVEHLARTREAAAAETLADLRRSLAERPVERSLGTARSPAPANDVASAAPAAQMARPHVFAPTPAQTDALARLDYELQVATISKKATIDAFARHIDADTSMVRAEMAEIDALIRRIQNGKVWRAKAALGRLRRSLTGGRTRV